MHKYRSDVCQICNHLKAISSQRSCVFHNGYIKEHMQDLVQSFHPVAIKLMKDSEESAFL